MQSFNAFGSKSIKVDGHTPIWLGTVSSRAKGARLADAYVKPGVLYPAGTPIEVKNDANGQPVASVLVTWELVSVDTTDHILTVKANRYGFAPSANDFLSIVGATFATGSAAGKVSAVAAGATAGTLAITMTDGKLDGASAGSLIAISAATAVATSGALIKVQPNAYLYNDVRFDAEIREDAGASCAAVDFHGEGILIDRTPAADVDAAMKVAVPNVIQING